MLKALFTWLGLSLCTLGYLCPTINPVLAQVTSDGTVNTEVNDDGKTAEITGGETRGDNLFHSFEDFSVKTGNEAFFNNTDSISNIFSRVTGGKISDIDGAIRANGSASLFLINPAGIIFGENASLNIGGSFYGSSASSILFEDGEFSAADLDKPPLLTVNAPIGLGFRDNPGDIVNRSRVNNGIGLQVLTGRAINLIGGDVQFEGGSVFAPGGGVELGGLAEAGSIGSDEQGNFVFSDNVSRGNVSLNEKSKVVVSSIEDAGVILINTGSLAVNNESGLFALGDAEINRQGKGGKVTINATSDVSFANTSNIFVGGAGGGSIQLDAKNLSITSGSSFVGGIAKDSGFAGTQAGDIVINVAENVLIDSLDESAEALITNNNLGTGNVGNIIINAKNIDFKNGGNIFSFNDGQGNIGSVNLTATENITFDGTQELSRSGVRNFLTENGTGDIGSINIATQNLTVTNGAVIESTGAGMGDSGDINIDVVDTIRIDGISSNLVLENGTSGTLNSEISSKVLSAANGDSGDIDIITGSLFISNGGLISSDLFGQGNAGQIKIDATNIVSLKDSVEGVLPELGIIKLPSQISARILRTGVGNGGSIEINTANFSITNQAQLNTSSLGQGDAGNISVNAKNSFIAENKSVISSNVGSPIENPAVGKVGNIFITARDIDLTGTAQLQAGAYSGATAEATGTVSLTASESISFTGARTGIFSNNDPGSFGNASNTQLFAPTITFNDGAIIEASNAANGQGGNITVESEQLSLNDSNISADAEGEEGASHFGRKTEEVEK